MDIGAMKRGQVARIAAFVLSLLIGSLVGSQAHAWGSMGHRLVAEVAAELTSKNSFWLANQKSLGMLANVPDNTWKSGQTGTEERPTHYFEPDAYYTSINDFYKFPRDWTKAVSMYGLDKLVEHGTAIWRTQQLFDLAVKKVIKRDFKGALAMAGTMAHYIGDLSQPLHVTTNFDGQHTNQKGIHKFFETTNLEGRDYKTIKKVVIKQAKALLRDPQFIKTNNTGLDRIIFNLIIRSYINKDEILDVDKKLGRNSDGADIMFDIALEKLADGAATLAVIYMGIWKAAGEPRNPQTVKVSVPEWVKPDYNTATSRRGKATPSFFSLKQYAPNYEADCE